MCSSILNALNIMESHWEVKLLGHASDSVFSRLSHIKNFVSMTINDVSSVL